MKWFDPLYWMSPDQYNSIINLLLTSILGGVGARVISGLLLIAAVWAILRKKNVILGVVFMTGCVCVMFGTWFYWLYSYIL